MSRLNKYTVVEIYNLCNKLYYRGFCEYILWSKFLNIGFSHTDAWSNHGSLFGIIDLASIPKDRYYLYRSIWNKKDNTLHILPHWNWDGRDG